MDPLQLLARSPRTAPTCRDLGTHRSTAGPIKHETSAACRSLDRSVLLARVLRTFAFDHSRRLPSPSATVRKAIAAGRTSSATRPRLSAGLP